MPRLDADDLTDGSSVWVTPSLGMSPGESLELIVGDRRLELEVRGVLESSSAAALGRFVLMDIAPAQRALGRLGRLDRIYVYAQGVERDWSAVLAPLLPPAASLLPAGTGTEDSRRMLGAFRWNLRMMSYATILVGAFLIYNTISAYIVRRRQQIGIVRAVGASRAMVRAAFLFEGRGVRRARRRGRSCPREAARGRGAGCGRADRQLALREQHTGGDRVSSLDGRDRGRVRNRGVGAVRVVARAGSRRRGAYRSDGECAALDFEVRTAGHRYTVAAAVLVVVAAALCLMPPADRIPIGGYAALVCLIGAAAMISPRLSDSGARSLRPVARAPVRRSVAGIAARGLAASLGRTSVIVAAMAVATALIVGMGVMVGSFRATVVDWVGYRLQADFYVSPAGGGGRGASPTMSEDVAEPLEAVPGVDGRRPLPHLSDSPCRRPGHARPRRRGALRSVLGDSIPRRTGAGGDLAAACRRRQRDRQRAVRLPSRRAVPATRSGCRWGTSRWRCAWRACSTTTRGSADS